MQNIVRWAQINSIYSVTFVKVEGGQCDLRLHRLSSESLGLSSLTLSDFPHVGEMSSL